MCSGAKGKMSKCEQQWKVRSPVGGEGKEFGVVLPWERLLCSVYRPDSPSARENAVESQTHTNRARP